MGVRVLSGTLLAWGLVNCLALLVLGASPRSMCLRPFMAPAIVNTKDIDIGEVLALFFIQNDGCFVLTVKVGVFHKGKGVLIWG